MPSGAAMIVANSSTVMPASGNSGSPACDAVGAREGARRLGEHLLGVLARLGHGARRLGRGVEQPHDGAELPDGAERGVVEVDHLAVRRHVGVGQRLLRGADPVGGDVAVGVEALHPLGRGPLAGALQHEVADLLRRLRVEAAGGGGVARIGVHLLGQFECLDRGVEEMLEEVRELNPAPVRRHDRLVAERGHRGRRERAERVALELVGVALDEL